MPLDAVTLRGLTRELQKSAVGAKIAFEVAGRTAPVVVELGDL